MGVKRLVSEHRGERQRARSAANRDERARDEPRGLHRLDSHATLTGLALASVAANVVIVVTGGAVRLTSSGLGCPTWPTCTGDSLTPTRAASFHGIIEDTNRQLTFVLAVIALLTLITAVRQRRQVGLAALALGVIPVQAVIGGISVLTHLNPWVVAVHFLASMASIAVAMLLWWRVRTGGGVHGSHTGIPGGATASVPAVRPIRLLALLTVVVTAAVLGIGTVVTGSGPHAGDKGATHRIAFDPAAVSQLHADAVMVLIGLSVGLLIALTATGADRSTQVAARWLVGLELGQGVIGYAQYFSHVPALLVGIHMLGACLVWVAALRVLLLAHGTRTGGSSGAGQARRRASRS